MEAGDTPTLVNVDKKCGRGYIGTVEVDCNATGPVTKEERHAATKIMDRIMEHTPKEHGQRVAYLQSNSGGKPKRFVSAAQSETENPSDRSKRRKNQSIMAAVVMVAFLSNCLVQPERITINQTLLDFASSRDAIAAGVQSKQRSKLEKMTLITWRTR